MTTRAPLVLNMMITLQFYRSKCIVLRPHSALLPRHPLFRIRSVFHITIHLTFFYVTTYFHEEVQITNQPNLSSGMANLVFWILTCFQCPFPCRTYSGAISLVCLLQLSFQSPNELHPFACFCHVNSLASCSVVSFSFAPHSGENIQ